MHVKTCSNQSSSSQSECSEFKGMLRRFMKAFTFSRAAVQLRLQPESSAGSERFGCLCMESRQRDCLGAAPCRRAIFLPSVALCEDCIASKNRHMEFGATKNEATAGLKASLVCSEPEKNTCDASAREMREEMLSPNPS